MTEARFKLYLENFKGAATGATGSTVDLTASLGLFSSVDLFAAAKGRERVIYAGIFEVS